MARRRNIINALLFFAPIGIVLSAIPQAPDYTATIGWGLAPVMLGAALVLALRNAQEQRAQAQRDGESEHTVTSGST
ncbi:hypothetical protein [Nesterenkonia jeotgali]|uniref:Uncharacterized protein n=1 Tax=Nesterenkonia jeotgali TaxID=317018 RepID=A0A0W8IHZ0_9MICC|nr:hypothetical protein [Nesterenkonia jeotgali]KUG59698.1 hypothetical protein AVL63_11390 [Nesterenkonia jeotgali]MBA8921992.1 hypothetical protein [Nesterenkonia jeotgali]